MKTTGDIIEEIITKHVRWEEIEEGQAKKKVKIIIKTQTSERVIFSSRGLTMEMIKEITERRIVFGLERQGDNIKIILEESEREWQEACLS